MHLFIPLITMQFLDSALPYLLIFSFDCFIAIVLIFLRGNRKIRGMMANMFQAKEVPPRFEHASSEIELLKSQRQSKEKEIYAFVRKSKVILPSFSALLATLLSMASL